jgi:hypothetical protein
VYEPVPGDLRVHEVREEQAERRTRVQQRARLDAALAAKVRLCGPLAWRERPDFTCFQAGTEIAAIRRGVTAELGSLANTQPKPEVGPFAPAPGAR